MPVPGSSSLPAHAGVFVTTHWSIVLSAGRPDSPESQAALETLCRAYWYPLYAYVRRCGHTPPDAEDLTQAFFARLFEKNFLAAVQPERGRFRSFMLAALNHFLANDWKRARRLKRGGGQTMMPIQIGEGETRYGAEPRDELTPEKIFERRWALTLLENALAGVREEYVATGKQAIFEELKFVLTGDETGPSYTEIGARLHLSSDAVKMAASRLRKRFRDRLRTEVRQTVESPDEVDDELRHMAAVLS